jgi:hypothetical protein
MKLVDAYAGLLQCSENGGIEKPTEKVFNFVDPKPTRVSAVEFTMRAPGYVAINGSFDT